MFLPRCAGALLAKPMVWGSYIRRCEFPPSGARVLPAAPGFWIGSIGNLDGGYLHGLMLCAFPWGHIDHGWLFFCRQVLHDQ